MRWAEPHPMLQRVRWAEAHPIDESIEAAYSTRAADRHESLELRDHPLVKPLRAIAIHRATHRRDRNRVLLAEAVDHDEPRPAARIAAVDDVPRVHVADDHVRGEQVLQERRERTLDLGREALPAVKG